MTYDTKGYRLLTLLLALTSQAGLFGPALAQNRDAPATRYGTGLGRLLTTEIERNRIDDLRFHVAEQIKEEERGPSFLHIDGITQRPDKPPAQRTTIWINGKPYSEAELPHGLSLVRNARGEVTAMASIVSKGKTEYAKIGDDIVRPQSVAEAKAIELAAQATKKAALGMTAP